MWYELILDDMTQVSPIETETNETVKSEELDWIHIVLLVRRIEQSSF